MADSGYRKSSRQFGRAERTGNMLYAESSPYLLQHALNPVNWYAWGNAAFSSAREQDKPIFLSIGYSACHWCHVMERESFEDVSTAEVLNSNFISIKVDREERPDVDDIYMSAVVAMTGSGGWPLNVFLTPSLKPFFGGTYFPPDGSRGGPTFKAVLKHISDAWVNRRAQVDKAAEELTAALKNMHSAQSYVASIEDESADAAVASLCSAFDRVNGGFGDAPKFPQPAALSLLLRYHARTGDERSLQMVGKTLDSMAAGGIFDHIGGGFHRYTVDSNWLTPHFEKMLYDNSLLASVYLEASQVTGRASYAYTARRTLDYVLRDMVDPAGAFHAAEDADSDGVEGKFYVWKQSEIEKVLGVEEARAFEAYYGVSEAGNFEGSNILHVNSSDKEPERLAGSIKKLLAARARRVSPGRDYKIIAAWNGMMISALVKGYMVLDGPRYLSAALQAAAFINDTMIEGSVLYHSCAKMKRGAAGFLDDYAFVGSAFLDLYEATGDMVWFDAADSLAVAMIERFQDKSAGGMFYSGGDDESILFRRKDYSDSAVPSGNAAAAMLLARIGRIKSDGSCADCAVGILTAGAASVSALPHGHLSMISASLAVKETPVEIVIAGKAGADDTRKLAYAARRCFLPNAVILLADSGSRGGHSARKQLPLLHGKKTIDGQAAAYVCAGRSCREPVTNAPDLEKILDEITLRNRKTGG